jgi:hypothetical protein
MLASIVSVPLRNPAFLTTSPRYKPDIPDDFQLAESLCKLCYTGVKDL